MNYALDSEARFVVSLATANLSPDREYAARQLIKGGLDWRRVRSLSKRHGVVPLMYRHLAVFGPSVPDPLQRSWSYDFSANSMHSRYLSSQLVHLSSLFEVHGIKVLSVKGPALSKQLYGDVSMRQFGDLDLLIDESDLDSVPPLLEKEGFASNLLQLDRTSLGFFIDNTDSLKRIRDSVTIDLHWRPSLRCFPFMPTFLELFARSTWVEMGGKVRTISPEDNLLLLCAHGARHGWTSLGDICDIAELIHSPGNLDYTYLRRQTRRLNSTRILSLGLSLAQHIGGARLDDDLCKFIAEEVDIIQWRASVTEKLFSRKRKGSDEVPIAAITLKVIPSFSGKLKYLISRLAMPTGADFAFFPLPRSLLLFYYLVRPVRIMRLVMHRISTLAGK